MDKYKKLKSYLDELYTYTKLISHNYYKNGQMTSKYIDIKNQIIDTEYQIPKNIFIIPSVPNFNYREQKETITSLLNNETILKLIVKESRNKFYELYLQRFNQDFKDYHLINACKNMSGIVTNICKNYNIPCKRILMHACFTNNDDLYNGGNYHYFNIVTLNNKEYLIDLAYRQFFTIEKSSLNRLGIPLLAGPLPGIFMTLNERRLKVATILLKYGLIELTPENGKDYFDAFALSYRNGLYYEETNDFSYKTQYTLEDYMNFLTGSDNQIKHESEHVLGFQSKPLKRPRMKF